MVPFFRIVLMPLSVTYDSNYLDRTLVIDFYFKLEIPCLILYLCGSPSLFSLIICLRKSQWKLLPRSLFKIIYK